MLAEAESFVANLLDRSTIGKQADLVERDPLAAGEGFSHRIRIAGFDTDDAGLRAQALDVGGNPGDEAATADGAEHGVDRLRMGAEDFHADRALTGNHVRIVKRMDEGEPLLLFKLDGVGIGIGVGFTSEHHFGAACLDRLNLDLRRGAGHHDHGARAEAGGSERHTLGMVAGRSADHATGERRCGQLGHLVVSTTQLEAEHRLHVLALEQQTIVDARRQIVGEFERGLDRDLVHVGVEDAFEIVRRGVHGSLGRQQKRLTVTA